MNRIFRFESSVDVLCSVFIFFFLSSTDSFAFQTGEINIHGDTIFARQLLKQAADNEDRQAFSRAIELIEQAQRIYAIYNLWELVLECEIRQSKLADNFETSALKIRHAQKAVLLAKKHLSGKHMLTASAYRQKAEALMMVENFDSANYFLKLALPAFKSSKDFIELGWTEILIAVNHLNQYDLDSCDIHFKKVEVLLQLQSIYLAKKDAQSALRYLTKTATAFTSDSTAINQKTFDISRLYYQLGNAHALNQDSNRALKNYQKSLVLNHHDFLDSLNFETNPSLEGIKQPIYFLETMQAKARVLSNIADDQKERETALATYQLCIQLIDSLQANYHTEIAKLNRGNQIKSIYEEAIRLAAKCYRDSQEERFIHLAFAFSEKSRNRILLEILRSREGKLHAKVPDSLLRIEKKLNMDLAFYQKVYEEAKAKKDEAKTKLYQQYLSKRRLSLIELREQLEVDYPKFYTWRNNRNSNSIFQIQSNLLNGKNALIEYFIGDSTAFAFVITKASLSIFPLDSPRDIKSLAQGFRKTLLDQQLFKRDTKIAFSDYQQRSHALYNAILTPLASAIPDHADELIIIPDDDLYLIPVEALCKSGDREEDFDFSKLSYLLYDFQVSYGYSANLLLRNRMRRKGMSDNSSCLAMAPYYDVTTPNIQSGTMEQLRSTIETLDGTALEIQQISQFTEGEFILGDNATEAVFKSLVKEFGIIHLATHGFADMSNSDLNKLAFSNIESDSLEDNLLHHYEIANMELQAQLAVLSACETGVGKYEKGEGVYSLTRSFMYAGVPSVVMSLWKINDISTSQLMPMFYENLDKGYSKVSALHEAKRRFVRETKTEFHHPFFWSSFVLIGERGGLKTSDPHSFLWLIGIGTLIVIGVCLLKRNLIS